MGKEEADIDDIGPFQLPREAWGGYRLASPAGDFTAYRFRLPQINSVSGF